MRYLTMELTNFSSLIEVATTLSIAFVAIEYVKSYTKVLCNQVFQFHEFITDSFGECAQTLVDEETLEHIDAHQIDGKSTINLIEKVKRNREILNNKIEEEQNKFKNKIENVCEAKNISSVSLWLFFYGIVALFLIGINIPSNTEHVFWSILTLCSFIYAISGWISKTENKSFFVNFASLRHAIVFFALALLISILVSSLWCVKLVPYINEFWEKMLILSIVLMYSNFIAAVIKVWINATSVKREISEMSNKLKKECSNLQKEIDRLLSVSECSNLLNLND